MNRTATVLAATVAAFLLAAAPAAAQGIGEPVPVPNVEGLVGVSDVPEPECVGEPFEIGPGEWDCLIEPIPTPEPEAATEGPAPVVAPAPEPAPVVVENGGWGWSDARESYTA